MNANEIKLLLKKVKESRDENEEVHQLIQF